MKTWPDSTKVDGNDNFKEPGKKGNLHMPLYLKKEHLCCLKKEKPPEHFKSRFSYIPT